jgi:hypothetical protein
VPVEVAVPGGPRDWLDEENDPSREKQIYFYGPIDVLKPLIVNKFSPKIADVYAWFATEAKWTKKGGVEYAPPIEGNDEDPLFDKGPGQDIDSEPHSDDDDAAAAGKQRVPPWVLKLWW